MKSKGLQLMIGNIPKPKKPTKMIRLESFLRIFFFFWRVQLFDSTTLQQKGFSGPTSVEAVVKIPPCGVVGKSTWKADNNRSIIYLAVKEQEQTVPTSVFIWSWMHSDTVQLVSWCLYNVLCLVSTNSLSRLLVCLFFLVATFFFLKTSFCCQRTHYHVFYPFVLF